MSLSDVVHDFEAWTREHNLVEQAMESCLQFIRNSSADDAEYHGTNPNEVQGHPIEAVVMKLENQSLVINNANLSYPYIDTRLGLYLPGPEMEHAVYSGLSYFGYYRLIVKADGEVDDDYLVYEDG